MITALDFIVTNYDTIILVITNILALLAKNPFAKDK